MKKAPPPLSTRSSSNKSPRHGVAHRGQTTPTELPTSQSSQTPIHEPIGPTGEQKVGTKAEGDEPFRDVISLQHKMDLPQEEASERIKSLRKQMQEATLQKQVHNSATSSPQTHVMSSSSRENLEGARSDSEQTALSAPLSTDSAKTVKATFEPTTGLRTPSYPFPRMSGRMNLKLNRGTSHMSAPSHKPFTLLSPTNTPSTAFADSPADGNDDHPSSEVSTPAAQPRGQDLDLGDDPNFPAPDLYDVILMLNSEPGIEAWWANVTQILAEVYGVERASLAIPGDMTDLENVPWGQKATFNVFSSDSVGSLNQESLPILEQEVASARSKIPDTLVIVTGSAKASKRPTLASRHSIAGVHPDSVLKGTRQRPLGPVRALSNIAGQENESESSSSGGSPKLIRQRLKTQSSFVSEGRLLQGSSDSASQTLRVVVHSALQALESEPDPLIVRTGIASLFGKRKPTVLTRAYMDSITPSEVKIDAAAKEKSLGVAYEEFEQPEPSPWSQSPAPSPAAQPDPEESPFFTQPASIDETAFEQDPPSYDYAATANQSLAAIGFDSTKSLLHVPLIQPVPSRGVLSSSLRFPIAILSILSSVTPYPRSLRHSLTHLLPHLASSYSLAQQYSTLQDRFKDAGGARYGPGFGLGGTFSDESSELELVAELSGQIAHGTVEQGRISTRSSTRSFSERSVPSRGSPGPSVGGTPLYDQLGLFPGLASTPGRSGVEMVDSYFLAKRQKTPQFATPGGRDVAGTSPGYSKSVKSKTAATTSSRRAMTAHRRQQEQPPPSPSRRQSDVTEDVGSGHGALDLTGRSEQTMSLPSASMSSQLPIQAVERPLPELISQLMLNSVPLQLFLAKPKSGELVWTNSKFDAFRTQGEGRVQDPWQNVHRSDREGLVRGWNQALRTGNQYTHNVRVKRFNNDSDYRWFIFRASTLLSHNGRLLYWIGSFLDIHEQYMAETKAAEQKETLVRDAKFRALANSIPQILFEAVESEGIVSANEQWYTFSGQSLEDARNLGFAKHVHPEDLKKCGVISADESISGQAVTPPSRSKSNSNNSTAQTVQADAELDSAHRSTTVTSLSKLVQDGIVNVEQDENGRVSYSTEIRLRSRGGEFRWFLVRLVKVESDLLNDGRASWYGTCTDINDRKGLERELNRVNKRIQHEMDGKTKFFANMSHEIRTPLNGILGSIPWLVESSLDHDQRRTLDTIQNSSNNLRELVDNILDVTKVEAGKMTLVHKWFHIRTLLEEIIDTIASRAIDRGLELNYMVDFDVPSNIKADPFRLRQILINLVGNAVKFTEYGETGVRCSIRKDPNAVAGSNTMLVAFDVLDTGRGFSEIDFQRLFKQFGQIEGSSNHDAGSGLGLFLSKQLVEMHGGQLSATSKVDQGSTFSFYVRVEVAPSGTDVASPHARSQQKRSSVSDTGSPTSRSDTRTPTMSLTKGITQSPGLSRYVASPEAQSPALASSSSSNPSVRSMSGHQTGRSSMTSLLPTPESGVSPSAAATTGNGRQILTEQAMASSPAIRRSHSENEPGLSGLRPEAMRPTMYSIIIICPAEFARTAIKQHIEQVVPHQIAVNVTTIPAVADFQSLMNGPTHPVFTHVVLDLPASADVMLFIRQTALLQATVVPALLVVTDHYQKRDILDDYTTLTKEGYKAFMIHKPVKPSIFALIFDPAQLGTLSKDRTRDMARSRTEDFKKVSEKVRKMIGGRSFRVLLVEDSDVNRLVILRYLKKVDLASETATNGLECTETVLSKPAGYYSLIICDIQMPKKNGYETCRELREWERAHQLAPMPVMALTANAMPEERAAAALAGFTDYLTKPVDFNILGTMMIALLDPKQPHIYLRDRPEILGV